MPTPIITLPIHTIEQARALAGLLRAYIDGQSPDTNEGQDWKPDPDLAGIAALYAHLDAGIAEAGKPSITSEEKRELYRKHIDAEREQWAGARRIMDAHLDAGIAEAGKPRTPAPTGVLVSAGALSIAGYDGEIDAPISGILIEMDDDNLRAAAGAMLGQMIEIRRLA